MKLYYDQKSAPLAFHTFIRYVSLPLSFLTTLWNMISEFASVTVYHWLYNADLFAYIITLILIAICFWGFMDWRSYAWYCMFAYLGFGVGYNLFTIMVYSSYAPSLADYAFGNLLGRLIYGILVGIYYYKRKPLFFDQMKPPLPAANTDKVGSDPTTQPPAACDPPLLFCRKCGAKLLPESEFCSQCGIRITKES